MRRRRREWRSWRGCAGLLRGGECEAGKLLLLGCRGGFLVQDEDVCLMAVHTGFALQKRVGFELGHLIGVAGFAGA